MKISILYITLFTVLAFSSCKEDEKPAPEPPPVQAPSIHLSKIPGVQSTMQATYYSQRVDSGFIGFITYIQGWATSYYKSTNGATLIPQKVESEGVSLKANKGIFSYNPGNTQGIDYGSAVIWEVSATLHNPYILEEIQQKVPEIGDLNVMDSIPLHENLEVAIDMDNPFTALGSIDSVNYLIKSNYGRVIKREGGNTPVIFTPTDLMQIRKGEAYIQVEAFSIIYKTYGSYKVAYVNKGVFNKQVWFY